MGVALPRPSLCQPTIDSALVNSPYVYRPNVKIILEKYQTLFPWQNYKVFADTPIYIYEKGVAHHASCGGG